MRRDDFLEATIGSTDLVHNLARRLTRDREAAEDLVQETFLAAFASWRKRGRPDRVEAWMATICLNLARSSFRRQRRRPDEMLQADAGMWEVADADTAAEALSRVERDAVHRALWELPEEQRIAITLMDICGLSAVETARAMGTPRGTVLSRVHRGRKVLAGKMWQEVNVVEP